MRRVLGLFVAGLRVGCALSTHALLESGWKTVLGNAEESGLFLKKLKLPLKISERAWWLKVSLLKSKSGVREAKDPMIACHTCLLSVVQQFASAPIDAGRVNHPCTLQTVSVSAKFCKQIDNSINKIPVPHLLAKITLHSASHCSNFETAETAVERIHFIDVSSNVL
eukprot:s3302_g5.t1